MSYPESVRYLYSLGNELRAGAKFGLETMQTLLAALGNPHQGRRFVHVAGTNGKGSTSAMIASALAQAGRKTGLYTSPHLIEPTERIQIGGRPETEAGFTRAFTAVHACAEELVTAGRIPSHPSYFETVTAMALWLFRESNCDISVVEVGLGGRLDATNVIAPELTVITPVSFDHEAFLGNTLESIAGEKAGILKPHVPLVLGRQLPVAQQVITDRARNLGCPVRSVGAAGVASGICDAQGCDFTVDELPYRCALAGRHQVDNAVAAILACQELGVPIRAIQAGLENVSWPGRLERIRRDPDFVLDGAHNPAGAVALADYIREFKAERPVWLIYGAMRDKAIDEVTSFLFPLADRLILTAADLPRALRPEAILEVTGDLEATVTRSVREAIGLASRAPAETTVFITGSLFVVGEARSILCAIS